MGKTNLSGPIKGIRNGAPTVAQTYVVQGNSSTTSFKWLTVAASSADPCLVETQLAVLTTDGGTTPTISVGTSSGGTNLINAQATTAGFYPASNAVVKSFLTSDTDIYITQGGTPNGTGVSCVRLDLTWVNTNSSTSQ